MSDYQVCFKLLIKSNQDKKKTTKKAGKHSIIKNRRKKRVTLCLHTVTLKMTFPDRKDSDY